METDETHVSYDFELPEKARQNSENQLKSCSNEDWYIRNKYHY